MIAVIDGCQGCGACLLTCPRHALRPVPGGLVVLGACDGCGECVEVCPVDAVTLVPLTATSTATPRSTDRSST